FFGWLTDLLGRKRLFWITLGVYLAATGATAFSPDLGFFLACRFLTGAGIGGEYAAINSAIQELVPARHRGQTDLVVNGSFWVGAALGAVGSVVLLEPGRLPLDMGWRLAFGIGAALGIVILFLRRHIPESPRWLMTHGRVEEAEAIVAAIEAQAARAGRSAGPTGPAEAARRRPAARRAAAQDDPARRGPNAAVALSAPHRRRAGADGLAGLLLQRDLLHLRAGARALLRCRHRGH